MENLYRGLQSEPKRISSDCKRKHREHFGVCTLVYVCCSVATLMVALDSNSALPLSIPGWRPMLISYAALGASLGQDSIGATADKTTTCQDACQQLLLFLYSSARLVRHNAALITCVLGTRCRGQGPETCRTKLLPSSTINSTGRVPYSPPLSSYLEIRVNRQQTLPAAVRRLQQAGFLFLARSGRFTAPTS